MTHDRKRALANLLKRFPLSHYVMRAVARLVSSRFTAGVVGVVLDAEGRVLLVEHVFHPQRPWGLPGGWMDAGEDPADAVAREIWEETGLRVHVLRPLLVQASRYNRRHIDMAFLCEARGRVGTLSDEILAYKWVWPDDMPLVVRFHRAAVDAMRQQRLVSEMTT